MTTDLKPDQMPRSPSLQTLEALTRELSDRGASALERERRITRHLADYYEGSDEPQVIGKSRRLLERDLALPPTSGAMRRAVASQVMPALCSRSPHAERARRVAQLEIVDTIEGILDGVFSAMAQHLSPSLAAERQARVTEALRSACIAERAALYYAEHASDACLTVALSADAATGRAILKRVTDNLGVCLNAARRSGPLAAMTPGERTKVERVQAFVDAAGNGEVLRALAEETGPEAFERLRRALFVPVADASPPEALARLTALYDSAAGRELTAVSAGAMAQVTPSIEQLMRHVLSEQL